MTNAPADNLAVYYADKLWKLMPAVYRAEDTDKLGSNGPLRELIGRIGASAAVVRRNIDRLWDDQSIETCDDWVIPFIADLVDTRLVSGLDAPGQRRDVANTIDYRRRKGTLGVIEQIAHDITGWDVKAVEFFRRLARSRHGLDPAVGAASVSDSAALLLAEGLVGRTTGTPAGGFADLRNRAGAANAGGPFDEFFHLPDFRAPKGNFGWYGITRLGVFVWRLESFPVGPVTPVAVKGCPGWYCFDPTGRDVSLFCKPRGSAVASGAWVSPGPTDIGAPITQAMLDASTFTPVVNGAGQTGGQLKTRNWGNDALSLPHVGDVFTIDGVEAADPQTGVATGSLQQFTVTALLSVDRSGAGVVPIAPPIALGGQATVANAPADGATLTFQNAASAVLYGEAMQVDAAQMLPALSLALRPERGRFSIGLPLLYGGGPPLTAQYAYAFPSEIGAGPYDRRAQATPIPTPPPRLQVRQTVTNPPTLMVQNGANATLITGADIAVVVPVSGTLEIEDSLTYSCGVGGVGAQTNVDAALTVKSASAALEMANTAVRANRPRPLIRMTPGATWRFQGNPGAKLTLDGLFVSGGDVELCGDFASVVIACCTFDPGSAAPDSSVGSPPSAPYRISADGQPLVPTRLLITGSVASLSIDRSVLGPIHTVEAANGSACGIVEAATISNSIVQALPVPPALPFARSDVADPARLLRIFQLALDPYTQWLRQHDPAIAALFAPLASPPLGSPQPNIGVMDALLARLNFLLAGPSLYDLDKPLFSQAPLSARFWMAYTQVKNPAVGAPAANRALLEDLIPFELATGALAFADGSLTLERCTVLGRVNAHRIEVSECILRELALVGDTQDGCIRFSAFVPGGALPRNYECSVIPDAATLFVSTDFGQPAYAQLLPNADLQCAPPSPANPSQQSTVLQGAVDGSEMGAYARDKNPIRARALLVKLQEYMPAGLVPVIVNVT